MVDPTKKKGKHLSKEDRIKIEDGVYGTDSANAVGRAIGRPASTVTREVKANRTVTMPKSRSMRPSASCSHHEECQDRGTACEGCKSSYTRCKDCRTHDCTKSCARYELAMCEDTEKWPYVCPDCCPKKKRCALPKVRYRAEEADAAYRERLSGSRAGVDLTEEELEGIRSVVLPLTKQGHSFEAIEANHADELLVSTRSLYRYQEAGLLGVTAADMPRKARVRPRKRARKAPKGRERVDRSGRRFEDFKELPIEDQARVVQADSVEGHQGNAHDLLSLHLVARAFQLYLLKDHADAAATVAALDRVERALGSPEAFDAAMGIILADRGVEFDDFEGMERSCLVKGAKRCRVFYCDAMNSNQKSECERNHEQLRRILPKKRTDMDKLSESDVAACCSHVNSYPLGRLGGLCPFQTLGALVPGKALSMLGLRMLPADSVILKPSLMAHAVEQ